MIKADVLIIHIFADEKRDFSSRKIDKRHLLVDWRGGDSTPAGEARAENPFISALADIN